MRKLGAGAGLIAFVVGVITVQRLSGAALLATVFVAICVAAWLSGKRLWSLMRRSRFLFLALAALYSFFTPGDRLWVVALVPAPTYEGALLALEHSTRLAGVLAFVCMLVTSYQRDVLVGGMLACLAPLRRLRFPVDRAALRMSIVLEMVSAPEGLPNWRECFSSEVDAESANEAVVQVHLPDWVRADAMALLLLTVAAEIIVRMFR